MKFPPRWVFEIWKKNKYDLGPLRICGTENAELKKVIGETRMLFGFSEEVTEQIVAVAWALYVSDSEGHANEGGILNDKTKFGFAGFLTAGAGHIVAAEHLIVNVKKEYHRVAGDSDKSAVAFALGHFGFVAPNTAHK